MIERAGSDANYTLEVRVSNAGAIALYERYGFRSVGTAPALLPGHRRGRDDHVARARRRLGPHRRERCTDLGDHLILAIETSCDDTCAAVVSRDGEIRANVISSQGVHEPVRRRRARRSPPATTSS